MDKPVADILYVPSSTEFLHNSDNLLGVAKMFHVLGLKWTLSPTLAEAAICGMFIDLDALKYHNRHLIDADGELGLAWW